jgi:hypothetical protein
MVYMRSRGDKTRFSLQKLLGLVTVMRVSKAKLKLGSQLAWGLGTGFAD